MNSSSYSAHSNEKEVLVMEGAPMFVVGVEQMLIDNSGSGDKFWKDFNRKSITIIYLFNTR